MNLFSHLQNSDRTIPIEAVWEALDRSQRSNAFRMLITSELGAEARLLNTCTDTHRLTPFGTREKLGREVWEDASQANWLEDFKAGEKLQLNNNYSEHIYVELMIDNTPELRELVKYEKPIGTVEGFDEIYMRLLSSKVGTKLFAHAAAALASSEVNPTATALAEHLLQNPELWPKGKGDTRNLKNHLAPFVLYYKKLTGIN